MTYRGVLVPILVAAVLGASGCSLFGSVHNGASDIPIIDIQWYLERVITSDGIYTSARRSSYIWFADEEACGGRPNCRPRGGKAVRGHGPCNGFTGAYRIDLDSSRLEIVELISTQIGCGGNIDDTEDAFFEVLGAAESFEVVGNELTILSDKGEIHFRAG